MGVRNATTRARLTGVVVFLFLGAAVLHRTGVGQPVLAETAGVHALFDLVAPTQTAILRAGDLADRTLFFRNDLAHADHPEVLTNPHRFMVNISTNPATTAIALETQRQIAVFFASDGKTIIQPEPKRYFEVPIQGPLPEELNYIP